MARAEHPIFAALYDVMNARMERTYFARHRRDLLSGARGRVLEIGAGTGANFPHYPAQVTLVAVEPDGHMLRRARVKAATLPRRILLVQGAAEALPFPDRAFDTVVATLVLCSVASPLQALHEIRRVLRSDGRFLFYEHVRAAARGWQRFQDVITPLWRRIGAGCHPNRDTVGALREAGFALTALEPLKFGPYPIRPQVKGVATVSREPAR